MGSDVQPERRVPSKPTSKKIAMKGGKQPQKHLLHKLIRQINQLLAESRNLTDIILDY